MANYYDNSLTTQVTGTVHIDNFGSVVPVTGTVQATTPLARQSAIGSFTATTTPVLLVGQNLARKQLWIFATGSSYLHVGPPGVTTGSYFLKMESDSFWELATPGGIYTGELWGVWNGTTGSAQVTEIR
jgi:hypothetical protein